MIIKYRLGNTYYEEELPLSQKVIKEMEEKLYESIEILEIETMYFLDNEQIRKEMDNMSITELSELADKLDNSVIDEDLISDIMSEGYTLIESIEIIENGNYLICESVFNNYELGIYLFENGLFASELTKDSLAQVESYLDFEKIGYDFYLDTRGFYTDKGFLVIY